MEDYTLNIGNGNLTVNTKPIVNIKTSISILGTGTELPVEVVADFTDIPHHLHQLYLQSIVSKYNSDTKVYCNIKEDPEPKTIEEKKKDWRLNKIVDIIFGKFK